MFQALEADQASPGIEPGNQQDKKKAPSLVFTRWGHNIRQRPTLPRGFPRSTIGSGGLNFRVRDGNGCDPTEMATGKICSVHTKSKNSISRNAVFHLNPDFVRSLDLDLKSARPPSWSDVTETKVK